MSFGCLPLSMEINDILSNLLILSEIFGITVFDQSGEHLCIYVVVVERILMDPFGCKLGK